MLYSTDKDTAIPSDHGPEGVLYYPKGVHALDAATKKAIEEKGVKVEAFKDDAKADAKATDKKE